MGRHRQKKAAGKAIATPNGKDRNVSVERMKQKLAAGETVFGTFFQRMTNPAIVSALPSDGLDFIVANTEHNALNLSDFLGIRSVLAHTHIAYLARL